MERFISLCSKGVTLETRFPLSKRGFWESRVGKAPCYSVGGCFRRSQYLGPKNFPQRSDTGDLAGLLEEQKGERACCMVGRGWMKDGTSLCSWKDFYCEPLKWS